MRDFNVKQENHFMNDWTVLPWPLDEPPVTVYIESFSCPSSYRPHTFLYHLHLIQLQVKEKNAWAGFNGNGNDKWGTVVKDLETWLTMKRTEWQLTVPYRLSSKGHSFVLISTGPYFPLYAVGKSPKEWNIMKWNERSEWNGSMISFLCAFLFSTA